MLAFEIIGVALASLRANLMRSILTMLGVIIGVAAVITMVALGEGAQSAVQEQLSGLGATRLTVRSGSSFGRNRAASRGARMTVDDAHAVLRNSEAIAGVVPQLDQNNVNVEYKNFKGTTSVTGTWVGYPAMENWRLAAGRFFTETEQEGNRRVAVLGSEIAGNMFPASVDPVGEEIRIQGVAFEVIGVLEEKGGGSPFFSADNVAVVPLATAMRRLFGTDYISSMTVEALSENHITMAMAEIESVLRRQHRLRPGVENDFRINRQTAFLDAMQSASRSFTFLLAGIAGVSLIVGGIGIMNIMLVSVTERTREIGIRRAIGARRSSIQLQFLIEAVVLSLLGGALGIGLGWVASSELARQAGWQMLVSTDSVGMAVGFSAAIGILFGFYPARRAARLDPIEALRHD